MGLMDQIGQAIDSDIQKEISLRPTKFPSVNEMLGGGLPEGRIVEIYGASQIGKSAFAVQAFPDEAVAYFDVDRKLCYEYVYQDGQESIIVNQALNNDDLFNKLHECIHLNSVFVIDSLPLIGNHLKDDRERFVWLERRFSSLQRALLNTRSSLIVLNGIRILPQTGRAYNPSEGVLSAAVKIKFSHAERRTSGRLIYLDVEQCFWMQENPRCTLIVNKNQIMEKNTEKS